MVLYLIGLGLGDVDDITLKGLKLIQAADAVFLEAYTSLLLSGSDPHETARALEEAYGLKQKNIRIADRDLVEQEAEKEILEPARSSKVAFLVVGDPVCATTHTDLWLRAKEMNIDVEIVHNASIMGGVGSCGLQLYNFGQTVSIPFFDDQWRPLSFYPKIQFNRSGKLHTLCLLDIKVKEPDFQVLMNTGRTRYLPPRFMTVSQAALQLIEAETTMQQHAYDIERTLCIGLARVGQTTQTICAGTLVELSSSVDVFGPPLHSLIITGGPLHDLEWDFVKQFLLPKSNYQRETPDHDDTDEQEHHPEDPAAAP
jgi:diphthine synthase